MNPEDLAALPENFVVSIDGPAGSGKSTMARLLAGAIGGVTIDTGAMYRAVTAAALERGVAPGDAAAVANVAASLRIEFERSAEGQKTIVDGADYTARIREPDVNAAVSVVAANPDVRRILVDLQREMGKTGRVVMEGRDIGSNVFPDAFFKFFIVAGDEVRAERRKKEMKEAGHGVSREEVLLNIRERDRIDSSRAAAPLIKPPGAREVDTSNLNIDEVLHTMINFMVSGGGISS